MTDNKAVAVAQANGLIDKSKELQKEILMEKLRSKTSQNKNLTDTSKAVRMALLDKRWAVDSQDRMILQKCLDSLQHCIKVSSLQSLIERLECLSRQLGLKFVVGTSGVNLFISSDMFYLEILVESSGGVKDVKIHHEGKIEQQSCEELVACISRGDFADFTAQLEGLTAVYQLNAEKKVKCKAFNALQSLEEDLCTLRQLQSFIKDPWAQVHKSPIGFLQKRRGGHAMRLTFFVSPYELLDKDKGLLPLTTELVTVGKPAPNTGIATLVAPSHTPVGLSALVLLEGSTSNKLQLSPIISGGPRPGKSGPVYAPLVPQNSAMLPACFTLKLSQPMPLCYELAKLIHGTTEVEVAGDWANAKPMLGLVAQQAYNKLTPGKTIELNLSKGLYVSLPEQTQCYFLCEPAGGGGLCGRLVASVPFTHPSHVPPLLACLRQQALFNALVASCVRVQTKHSVDVESVVVFEVSALSCSHISVSLEQPGAGGAGGGGGGEGGMATVELDLSEPAAPRAAVCTLHHAAHSHLDEYITRVLQKTHSIPITLRSLVKIWEREASTKQMNGGYSALDSNFNCGVGGLDPGGGGEGGVKQEPGVRAAPPPLAHYPAGVNHPHHTGQYLSEQQHHLSMMCTEDVKPGGEERRGKKRKAEDPWGGGGGGAPAPAPPAPAAHKRGRLAHDGHDSGSDTDNSDTYVEYDEDTNSSIENMGGRSSSVSREAASDAEPGDGERDHDHGVNHADGDDHLRNSFHKSDHKRQKLKNKEDARGRNLLLELTEGKSYMPSSVSITPIGAGGGALPPALCLDRRPGIEIIPISAAPPAALPSSITITPISSGQVKPLEERRDRKPGKDKEKKKKRRRDDAMGPPDKVPPKQDPLTKPVSVSIKPTPADGSPHRATPSPTHRPAAAAAAAKSPSPKGKPPSHHSSPRHSPVPSSPKHLPGYSSPKNHSISSPKHGSSSGKPSMSALKSATGGSPSPSGKSGTTGYDLTKKLAKDGYAAPSSRDKDKKHSGLSFSSSSGRSSPKPKNPAKLKQLEITPVSCDSPPADALVSPPNVEVSKQAGGAGGLARNRKGSLSAVIDKLKSAQHAGDAELGPKPSAAPPARYADSKTSPGGAKICDPKNQEYMVKPSSDGIKITINKTGRSKESSGGSKLNYGSGSSRQSSPQLTPPSQGSPKTHTGLKPGVISGPASKKTQAMQMSKSGGGTPGSTPPKASASPADSSSQGGAPKMPYSKSSSSAGAGINLSKSATKPSSGSPKSGGADLSKMMRDRERDKAKAKLMGNSERSIFSSKSERHSSPSGSRDDVDGDRYKAAKDASFLVERLIKPLDTTFQIPKLKNQTTPDKNSPVSQYESRSMVNDFARNLDQSKYPYPHYDNPNSRTPEALQKSAYPLNVPKPMLNMGSVSPKTVTPVKMENPIEYTKAMTESISKSESPQQKDDAKEYPYPLMPLDFKTDVSKGFATPKDPEDRKGADACMKPPASGAVARSGATTPQEAAEMLLDFSASSQGVGGSKVSGLVAVRPVYPPSPAPARSPLALVAPSPHSNSPGITDDELMDEALVGPGK